MTGWNSLHRFPLPPQARSLNDKMPNRLPDPGLPQEEWTECAPSSYIPGGRILKSAGRLRAALGRLPEEQSQVASSLSASASLMAKQF